MYDLFVILEYDFNNHEMRKILHDRLDTQSTCVLCNKHRLHILATYYFVFLAFSSQNMKKK